MKAAVEEKIVSLLGLITAGVILTLTVIEQIQIDRLVSEAAEVGWIIDTSPDFLQKNVRMSFALGLGAMSLWSKPTRSVAIVTGWVLSGIAALTYAEMNPFDRAEPIIHLAAFGCLVIATIFIRHQRSGPLIAILAVVFVLINYADWFFWTERLKRAAAVEPLDRYSRVGNLLHGAHPWHIAVLIVTSCLMIWEIRLLAKRPVPSV